MVAAVFAACGISLGIQARILARNILVWCFAEEKNGLNFPFAFGEGAVSYLSQLIIHNPPLASVEFSVVNCFADIEICKASSLLPGPAMFHVEAR